MRHGLLSGETVGGWNFFGDPERFDWWDHDSMKTEDTDTRLKTNISHRIHGTSIIVYFDLQNKSKHNVGKYTS